MEFNLACSFNIDSIPGVSTRVESALQTGINGGGSFPSSMSDTPVMATVNFANGRLTHVFVQETMPSGQFGRALYEAAFKDGHPIAAEIWNGRGMDRAVWDEDQRKMVPVQEIQNG